MEDSSPFNNGQSNRENVSLIFNAIIIPVDLIGVKLMSNQCKINWADTRLRQAVELYKEQTFFPGHKVYPIYTILTLLQYYFKPRSLA